MARIQKLPVLSLGALLAASLAAFYVTRDGGANRIVAKPAAGGEQTALVDTRMMRSARSLAPLADSTDEQDLAREALRLADRELDQAFATATREAAEARPPSSGPLKQAADYVARVKARVAASRDRVARLTQAPPAKDAAAEDLDLAKAQLALDEDELEDAQLALARQGGDRLARLQREADQRQSAQQTPVAMPPVAAGGAPSTLKDQIVLWRAMNSRLALLDAAAREAAGVAAQLEYEHDMMDSFLATKEPSGQDAPASPADPAAAVERLRRLASETKAQAETAKRIDAAQRLADVYHRWRAAVERKRRAAMHAAAGSAAAILAVALAALLASWGVRRAIHGIGDRRRTYHLQLLGSVAVRLAGAAAILLIVFGAPTQMTTIIGLATAGLTVALKDFIVAFLGWFVLMGRNGLRVGDWVEIEGVSGEVIEIGLLKTVLLEMGNWAASGHPTGRRVAFVNSFAMERHYFNFSTSGQWLWDELLVSLPVDVDAYRAADQIRELVEKETAADAVEAERDWERVTRQYGMAPFSARPAVGLRPAAQGMEASARYITRAPRRFEMKGRLMKQIVDLLRKPVEAVSEPNPR